MLRSATTKLHGWYLTLTAPRGDGRTEPGFEIAQSMGIALLGLIVAAAFATALEALGADVITNIRNQLGLGGGDGGGGGGGG